MPAADTQDASAITDAATRGVVGAMLSRMEALEDALLEERRLRMADHATMEERIWRLEAAHASSGDGPHLDRLRAESGSASSRPRKQSSGHCDPSQLPARSEWWRQCSQVAL